MAKISKKDIKKIVNTAMSLVMRKLNVRIPSKGTLKAIARVARKIRLDLKKQAKKTQKNRTKVARMSAKKVVNRSKERP